MKLWYPLALTHLGVDPYGHLAIFSAAQDLVAEGSYN